MATIERMTVALGIDTDGFRRGLRRASNRLQGFSRDSSGQLRDMRGRFISEGDRAGIGWGRAFANAAQNVGGALGNVFKGLAKKPVVLTAVIAAGAALGGALVNAFTIALAGIALVGISAYILKDVPKIKSAFKELKKTAKDVFRGAAEPMVEPIETAIDDIKISLLRLKPDFKELFQSVADSGASKHLTDGLHGMVEEITHGLTDMMNKSAPVFEGFEYLMKKIGEGLGGFFREIGKEAPSAKQALKDFGVFIKEALIWTGKLIAFLTKVYMKIRPIINKVWDFGVAFRDVFAWLYDILVGHSIIPDLIKDIAWWVLSLPGRILGSLAKLAGKVVGKFADMRHRALGKVKDFVTKVALKLAALPMKAWHALSDFSSKIASRGWEAGRRLVGALRDKIGDAVDKVRSLPGKAKDALWNIGDKLYSSGKALLQGFINGIKDKADDVKNAAWSVVSSVSGLFPNSPAKEGPFSGKGWTPHRGAALIDGFRRGMHSAMPAMRKELDSMYGAVPDMRADVSGVIRAGRSKGPVLTVNMTGAPEWLKQGIREIVRTDGGGDVQFTFGGTH